ncbi:kinase domain-containing protein [Xylaria arbuscula]|nr:kinase domain-containing protein [Xylaria arbuscula]
MRQKLGAHLKAARLVSERPSPTKRQPFPCHYTHLIKREYSAPQYIPVEDVETIDRYKTGGYHPIHIGDRLGPENRFEIVNKLGHGGYSTVWLARDKAEGRYVALKVAVAVSESSHTSRETSILRELEQSLAGDDEPPSAVGVPRVRAVFSHAGPNGVHACLATDPCMCSVIESKEATRKVLPFDPAVSRRITARLIRTVAFLHSRGVAHGDIHPRNVLLKLPDLSSMTVNELYLKYGEPAQEDILPWGGAPFTPSAHLPQYVVVPAWFGKPCEDATLEDADVTLADFGEAWKPADTRRYTRRYTLNTPALYRPPEAMFAQAQQIPISLAADIWTLGCCIFAVFGDSVLFKGLWADENDVFAENISALGKPPQVWWDLWRKRSKFFDERGEWLPTSERTVDEMYHSLEDRAADSFKRDQPSGLGDEEMADLLSMLRGMLRWRPEERVSADDLVKGAWMNKWGDKTD